MILENFRKTFFHQAAILRILMALIFLSAGVFRIVWPDAAQLEMSMLELPVWFSWAIAGLEIVSGLGLLLNAYVKQLVWLLIIFVAAALVWSLIISAGDIISGWRDLFALDLNATDFFLHFVFLAVLIHLARRAKV